MQQLSLFIPIGTPVTYRGYPGRVAQGVTIGSDGELKPYSRRGTITIRYKKPSGMWEVTLPIWKLQDALRSRGCKVAVIRPRWWQCLTKQSEVQIVWPDMSSANVRCYVWQIDRVVEDTVRLHEIFARSFG